MIKKLFFAILISIVALFTFTSAVFAYPTQNPIGDDDEVLDCSYITEGDCKSNGNSSCHRSGQYLACIEYRSSPSTPEMQTCVITPNSQYPQSINSFCGTMPRVIESGDSTAIPECTGNTIGECTINGTSCFLSGRYKACKNDHVFPKTCDISTISDQPRNSDSNDLALITNFCGSYTQKNIAPEQQPGGTSPGGGGNNSGNGGNGGNSGNSGNSGEYQGNIPGIPDTNDTSGSGTNVFTPHESTYQDESSPATFSGNCRPLLGLTSWDCGVNISDESTLQAGIWQIALNVLANISVIAAYLVLGYVIYGGYLYTMSGGSAEKILEGKKTLTRAFIGLAIVILANIIMNTIRFVLIGANNNLLDCSTSQCVDPTGMVSSAIQWAVGIAGVVAVIFIIYGGISFMTSSGDPGKVKKAKDMLLYSTIGLIVVALAEIITAFVTNIINNAS